MEREEKGDQKSPLLLVRVQVQRQHTRYLFGVLRFCFMV